MPSNADANIAGLSGSVHASVFTRLVRNFGWLAGSTGFSAAASLVYVGLTARALGPLAFGSFALVMTYGELVTNLAQFQSWKAVIAFGAGHRQAGDNAALRRLFGYTASLDWLSGLIGSLLAILGLWFVAPLLHWTSAQVHAALWFGTALLLTSSTTPAGMLRLCNRFDLQVCSEAVAQITRLVGCLAGWAIGAGPDWFLGVWALAALLQLISQWAAVLAVGERPSLNARTIKLAHRENRSLWSFMLKTSASSSLSLFWMQCSTLIVGASAGQVEAGGLRLTYRFSQAMMKPVEIATKALFPELARLVASSDQIAMRRMLLRISGVSAVFASLMLLGVGLFGRELLGLVAGRSFEFAHDLLFLLCIASAINVASFALEPFLNAHFRAGTVLRTYVVAALLYALLLVVLLPVTGVNAAAFAAIAAALAIMLQLGVSTIRILSRTSDDRSQERAIDANLSAVR